MAMREIMQACIDAGGTITGEHGVGLDKLEYMALIFSPESLAAHVRAARRVRSGAARESGQGRAGALVPRVACAPSSTRATVTGMRVRASTSQRRDAVRDAARRARAAAHRRRAAPGSTPAARCDDADAALARAATTRSSSTSPGDLTLTARAGTTLAEIARATRAEGQWLALDPFGVDDGTLGATIATASAGPLAHAFGTPRDNVLGVEVVTGTGDDRARAAGAS